MKISSLSLLAFILLLQSCYSYKAIDTGTTTLTEGKTYKVKIDNHFEKTQFVSMNDSVAHFKAGKKDIQIPKNEMGAIQVRKFSTVKTVCTFTGIIAFVAIISVLTRMNNAEMGEIKNPS